MATEIDSDLFEWSYEGGVALRYRPYTLRRAVLLRFFFLIRTSWGPLPFYSTSPNDHSTQLQLASLLAR